MGFQARLPEKFTKIAVKQSSDLGAKASFTKYHVMDRWNNTGSYPSMLPDQLEEQLATIGFLVDAEFRHGSSSELFQFTLFLLGSLLQQHAKELDAASLHALGAQIIELSGSTADQADSKQPDLPSLVSTVRRQLIDAAVSYSGGNLSQAGRCLGISPQAVYQHVKRRHVEREAS